jgi:hypothetical protein
VIYLLQSAWLAAAAVIVIPVILHLWNDRRGKVLRIGSIVLLTGDSQRMSWTRRLSQWWLLLVRCLLLLALAVLLARPYWRGGLAAHGKGWVLVGDGVPDARRMVVDSFVKAGWELHVLGDSGNYWNGFRMADRVAPAGVPFYVLTTALVQRFAGERPSTEREVHWEVYTPADSAHRWIQAAWLLPGDSIRVLEGGSRPTGSSFFAVSVAAKDGLENGFRVMQRDGRWAVSLDSQPPVVADTSVLRIVIFTDPAFRQDGRYVGAALRALQQYTLRRMEVSVVSGVSLTSGGSVAGGLNGIGGDWLFWLSVRPLPVLPGFTHILCYEQGKGKVVDTRVEGIEWMKEVEGPAIGQEVWENGYGRAVLSVDGVNYHFYGRFDPDWSGLVWSPSFPVLLERLLFAEDRVAAGGVSAAADRRVLDLAQIGPVRDGITRWKVAERSVDLAPALWVLIVLLFILERVLSHGKKKT